MFSLRDWTWEKQVSIDWSNVDDIMAHNFTLHQLMDAHAPLRPHLESLGPVLPVSRLFLSHDPADRAQQRRLITEWYGMGLFVERSERWCRRCGGNGHTITSCTTACETVSDSSPVVQRLPNAQVDKRLRQQAHESTAAPSPRQRPRAAPGDNRAVIDPQKYKGVIVMFDEDRRVGELSVPSVGVFSFHVDRVNYGLKRIRLKDEVRLRIERTEDRSVAIDVRPVNTTLSVQDVDAFLTQCAGLRGEGRDSKLSSTITIMRRILDQRRSWPEFLSRLHDFSINQRLVGIKTIVQLVNGSENQIPIHHTLLSRFLKLLCSGDGVRNFYPTALLTTIPVGEDAARHAKENPNALDELIELVNFLARLRTRLESPLETVQPVLDRMHDIIGACASLPTADRRKLKYVQDSVRRLATPIAPITLLPTVDELSTPASHPQSPFHYKNLPNAASDFTDVDSLIRAHCDLLRADAFAQLSNVLAASCFTLEGWAPSSSIKEDIQYTPLFDNVACLGRCCTKNHGEAYGYVFKIRAVKEHQNVPWNHSLRRGQLVIFTTGVDRTKVVADEVFWGIVMLWDSCLLQQGITVVHPIEGSDFDLLVDRLGRNQALGKPECSMLLECPVFYQGYAPVMRALRTFTGLDPLKLPLRSYLISSAPSGSPEPQTSVIPEYFAETFNRTLTNLTRNLTLDIGQEATLRSLKDRVVLVQGPPGTGKSFIGCRVLEAVVRFRRQMGNGEALRYVDVTKLPNCAPSTLAPQLGPVLVITYKNHALDEFMVDIIRSGLWCGTARSRPCKCAPDVRRSVVSDGCCPNCCEHQAKVVRVGGRSREQSLERYNLDELMNGRPSSHELSSARAKLINLMREVERLANDIAKLERGEMIADAYEESVSPKHRHLLPFDAIGTWLDGKEYVGKDTTVSKPFDAVLVRDLDSVSFKLDEKEEKEAVVERPQDPDDGPQLSNFAAMRADPWLKHENGDTDQCRSTMISSEAIQLGRSHRNGIIPPCPVQAQEDLLSLWSLAPQHRHDLYVHWIRCAIATRAAEYLENIDMIDVTAMLVQHAKDIARRDVLSSTDVIGLTTTGCAMHQALLRSVKPCVLIVEEAAEILESQLLACFADSLKQIVLVGDHYQLKPKVENHELELHNAMNTSLFEHMARRLQPQVLTEQRRMQPRIADLVRPFYDVTPLRDHSSVLTRKYVDADGVAHPTDTVPGLPRQVYFWSHTHPEEQATRGRSQVNIMEQRMTLLLVQHLLGQRVRPESITVITPYLGQRNLLKNTLRSVFRQDIKVSTVDRFQGDEADIIILSLVRTKTLTEFIRMRNRMIVACSRARFAMVMLGSEELLLQSPHWAQLLAGLHAGGDIGPLLPVSDQRTGRTAQVSPDTPVESWFTVVSC